VNGRHRRPGRPAVSFVAVVAVLVGLVLVVALVRAASSGRDSATPGGPGASSPWTEPSVPRSPAPSSSPSSPATASPPGDRERLVIHGTGDVNLDPDYIPDFRQHGYGWAWSGLDGLFRRDDLTVINLECAVSEIGTPVPKEFTFRGDPAALPVARDAGVEVANLGNNHSQDFGTEAMLDTRANLLEAGIAPVGAGRNLAEATEPALFELKGWRIAVLGFGGVFPSEDWFAGPDHPGMASGDDIPTMVEAVKAADEVADVVIVAIHWGVELDLQPRPEDVERAHAMIDAGADAVFGHHSHRLNPMGVYRGRPIFWSLGNFVWPNFSHEGSVTAVAEVVVSPDGRVSGRLIPAFIESAGHPVLTAS
jgi:hypothetical protein